MALLILPHLCTRILLLAWLPLSAAASGHRVAPALCEGDGWQPVEVEDVPLRLVSGMVGALWPLLYDTGKRWEGCLLDELQTAVEGCTQVVGNGSQVAPQGGALAEVEVEGQGVWPLPPDAIVWWLALNQTCPFHESSWLFIEAQAAALANGTFLLLVGPLPVILASNTGFIEPDESGIPPPAPCGSARQDCCPSPDGAAYSCSVAGLACMQHGPDIICEAPRCAAPAAVEGRPGVFVCPEGSSGALLVGTLV